MKQDAYATELPIFKVDPKHLIYGFGTIKYEKNPRFNYVCEYEGHLKDGKRYKFGKLKFKFDNGKQDI